MKIQLYKIGMLMLLVVASNKSLIAQDLHTDLRMIEKTYLGLSNFSNELVYTSYPTHERINLESTLNGKIIRSGKKVYNKIGEMETFRNGKYFLIIDHESKLIVVDDDLGTQSYGAVYPLDSVLKTMDSYVLGQNSTILRSYIFNFSGKEYDKIELSFDPRTYIIQRISIFYNYVADATDEDPDYKPLLDIKYTNIILNPIINEYQFSETKYVTIASDGSLTLKPAYKDYELVIQKVKRVK